MDGNDNPLFWKPSRKRFLLEIAAALVILLLLLFIGKDKNNAHNKTNTLLTHDGMTTETKHSSALHYCQNNRSNQRVVLDPEWEFQAYWTVGFGW